MDHATHSKILNYNHIVDGIYAGNNQCCVLGLVEVLQKENITADISLEQEAIDQPFGVDMYTWIPIVDHQAPTVQQLDFAISTIQTLLAQNRRIYIHCKNGHGRTSTVLSGYLMKIKGYTYEDAFAYIYENRPSTHIQDEQVSFLKDYEKILQQSVLK